MKISANINQVSFRASETGDNFDSSEKKKVVKRIEEDRLAKQPVRSLAYANGIYEALIRPIPRVGPLLQIPAYGIAWMYIGADVYDKYLRGEDDTYQKPSLKRMVKRVIYQSFASMALTGAAVYAGKWVAGKSYDFVINKLGRAQNLKNKKIIQVAAGMASLAALCKPIDKFTRDVIMKKAVDPLMDIKQQQLISNYFKRHKKISKEIVENQSPVTKRFNDFLDKERIIV